MGGTAYKYPSRGPNGVQRPLEAVLHRSYRPTPRMEPKPKLVPLSSLISVVKRSAVLADGRLPVKWVSGRQEAPTINNCFIRLHTGVALMGGPEKYRKSKMFESGRPLGALKASKNVGGEAPHIFGWF